MSGTRPRVTAEVVKAAREAREARVAKERAEKLVVAAIWATAVSLVAALLFMASSA